MSISNVRLPELQTLTNGLNAILLSPEYPGGQVTILARDANPYTSTHPSEIINCQLVDGVKVKLLCKYAAGRGHTAYGHRGDISYEAEVYRQVLQPLTISIPRYYGLYKYPLTGEMWLILEYIDRSMQISYSNDRKLDHKIMYAAACWLGQFHRANEALLSSTSMPFLHRYNADYYLGWAARTVALAGHLHQRFPWLKTLCEGFKLFVDRLLEPPAIIIHGEFYPDNILFHHGKVFPVDWQSTAIAVGEIDFASLVEHWPSSVVERCKVEYLQARWPENPPVDFDEKVDVACLYWRFRWLGDRSEWTADEQYRWRFLDLQLIGERMGLI